jgi:3,4-dihydroxy 2-butanone 4-phosphate synthase
VSTAALDQALAAVAAGRMVVIAGDRLRGGDIDLMCAARHVTADIINFMATHGRGLICLAVTPERATRLGLAVFPLIAQAAGVLARPSACEASIDLARMAGAGDAAVICSIMRDDGEMARLEDIGDMLNEHGLAVAQIGELIARLDAERD